MQSPCCIFKKRPRRRAGVAACLVSAVFPSQCYHASLSAAELEQRCLFTFTASWIRLSISRRSAVSHKFCSKKMKLSLRKSLQFVGTLTHGLLSELQAPSTSSAAGDKEWSVEKPPVCCSFSRALLLLLLLLLLHSQSSALIESHRTWNFFTLWGPVNMMSMWAGSLFAQVSWLQFKVILLGVPWPLLHAHRVFSSFAWTRHNKSTLITGP